MFGLFKKKDRQAIATVSEAKKGSNSHNDLALKGISLHEDLKGLVWIGDGPYKNYEHKPRSQDTIRVGPLVMTFSMYTQEEPSLLYTSMRYKAVENLHSVDRPPYFPTYQGLTPEQKFVYLNLLMNPYDSSINIGFVFILYYGLERHLLSGNFEKAFQTILKLRDVHTNKSFQSYSASALILSAMLHERGDLVRDFIDSLDKEHEYEFSDNLFLICAYSFNTALDANDLVRMAKSFDFKNTNYIKKYPEVFIDSLRSVLLEKVGTDSILLKDLWPEAEVQKSKLSTQRLFANVSISESSIEVPQLLSNNALKSEVNDFLKLSHEKVKKLLAERRKAGKPILEKETKKQEKVLVFDSEYETSLLDSLAQCSNDPVRRHFTYIYLQNFYYKYRNLDVQYLEKCKKYCLIDIECLDELHEAYIKQEIARVKSLEDIYGEAETTNRIQEIEEQGFIGNIPAFSRLAIIYEKEAKFSEAIEICQKAIEADQSDEEFQKTIKRLESKLE